jgi:hypothetical protein
MASAPNKLVGGFDMWMVVGRVSAPCGVTGSNRQHDRLFRGVFDAIMVMFHTRDERARERARFL